MCEKCDCKKNDTENLPSDEREEVTLIFEDIENRFSDISDLREARTSFKEIGLTKSKVDLDEGSMDFTGLLTTAQLYELFRQLQDMSLLDEVNLEDNLVIVLE